MHESCHEYFYIRILLCAAFFFGFIFYTLKVVPSYMLFCGIDEKL
ncbi:hypothetical protein NMT12_40069 [metagenome]